MSILPPSISPLKPSRWPLDAKAVGQSEGDLASRPPGDVDRLHHREARRLRIPEIAFEIEDRRALDLRFVERRDGQQLGGAEEGVHRPVGVGGDQHHRARGRLAEIGRGRDELDAGRGEVVPVELAELIGRHLADEARLAAQGRDARRGVPAEPPLISRAGPIWS